MLINGSGAYENKSYSQNEDILSDPHRIFNADDSVLSLDPK